MPLSFPLFVIALNRKSEEVCTRCNICIFTEENITGAKKKRALGEDVRENQNERVGGCVGARKKKSKVWCCGIEGGVFRKYLREGNDRKFIKLYAWSISALAELQARMANWSVWIGWKFRVFLERNIIHRNHERKKKKSIFAIEKADLWRLRD